MATPPTARMRELETLLARIRNAGNIQLNYEMWDDHGREFASPEQIATMEADLASSRQEYDAAKNALEGLVAATRAEAPAEIAAWADAHEAYLAAFSSDCVATSERMEWAKVREGTIAFVKENLVYVTDDVERYRRLFGIDPRTLERID